MISEFAVWFVITFWPTEETQLDQGSDKPSMKRIVKSFLTQFMSVIIKFKWDVLSEFKTAK